MPLPAILGALLSAVDFDGIAARISPDKDERQRIAGELRAGIIANAGKLDQAAADIVKAEAQGESWLQRNWRPILMLTVVAIVANNHLIYPYAAMMGAPVVLIDLPERLWDLMTLGVGGYVAGRSAEKVAKVWKGTNE